MKYDICVFGGCALDSFFYKDSLGNIPLTPNLLQSGGKGANQAVAAARAGAKVALVSRLGKDEIGQKILENLVYNNVLTNNVEVVDGLQNDCSNIIIDEKTKDNEIIRFSGAIDSFTTDMIEKYKNVFLHSKIVIAQMKAPKEVSVELINFCYEHKIPLVITPCRPQKLCITDEGNKELIDKITYITANKKECATIFGTNNIEDCVSKYPNKLIVTLGENGVVFHDGTQIVHIPANKIENLVDTTGAGDTFNGNLFAALVNGSSLKDSIIRAQFASSMKIQKQGAQEGMPYKEELDRYITNQLLSDSEYIREFEIALNSIVEASEEIAKKKITNIKMKEDSTFVTESDLLVEKKIIDDIVKQYPNDNFVTEEFNNENTIKDRTWVIDPIDGTAHYMKNSLFWGIQLAFVDRGEIKFSIIYLPKLEELYYAIKNKGAYLNNKKISRKKEVEFNQSIIEFCGSLHKKYEEKKILFNRMINNKERPANFMHINSCAFAFSNLLSGRTDTLILSTKKSWDILPGIFMMEESGLKTYDYNDIKIYSVTKNIEEFLTK